MSNTPAPAAKPAADEAKVVAPAANQPASDKPAEKTVASK